MLYTRVPRLFADLAIACGDARYGHLLRFLARHRGQPSKFPLAGDFCSYYVPKNLYQLKLQNKAANG